MHTYTALYETREDAERVQSELQRLGVIDADGASVAGRERLDESDGDGGFWSARKKGVTPPEPDRRLYEEGVRRGGFLLTVDVDDERTVEVQEVLNRSNPVDLDDREREYGQADRAARTDTSVPTTEPAPSAATATSVQTLQSGQEEHIPIVEERLVVGKRAVDRGGARIRAYTVEQPVHESVQLREEHVDIQRRPVDQPLSAADDAFRDREFVVRETAEEAVVAKEARVIEELVVRKDEAERTEEIDDAVRHTEVDVDRRAPSRDRDRDGLPG